MSRISTLQDVVDWDLCIGCGACASACEHGAVTLVDILDRGIRPRFDDACSACSRCLSICPGYQLDAGWATGGRPSMTAADREFGPALEIWEGHATDPEIRFNASSGGALTALALYCMERRDMDYVVHSAMDEETPWRNKTQVSRNAEDLKKRAASRYAVSSPCDGFPYVKEAERSAVFIGKPCDAAAAFASRQNDALLDEKLGVVLTFFCAGTPSSQGTLDLLDTLGLQGDDAQSVRYRGHGWPGRFVVNGTEEHTLTYAKSWAFLNKYRSLRCHLCPDGLGRIADLSCGDAWHRYEGVGEGEDEEGEDAGGNPGESLILVNTERGRDIIRGAVQAGYLTAELVTPAEVIAAQGLLNRRRQLFGRLLALRLFGRPVPRFVGFSLFSGWLQLPLAEKLRSVAGTAHRAIKKGWTRRRRIHWPD